MSYDISVYFPAEESPTFEQWQSVLAQFEVATSLMNRFELGKIQGWLPVLVGETESGFELFSEELEAADQQELEIPEGFSYGVTFSASNDHDSLFATVWCSAALAKCTGGILIDCQSGDEVSSTDVQQWAQEATEEIPSSESPISEAAENLAHIAIDSAIDIISSGEDLIPFLLSVKSGEFYDHTLVAETAADAVALAGELVRSFPESVSIYVVAFFGTMEMDDTTVDAVLVEVGERDQEVSFVFGQPFSLHQDGDTVEIELLSDAIIILDQSENLFGEV